MFMVIRVIYDYHMFDAPQPSLPDVWLCHMIGIILLLLLSSSLWFTAAQVQKLDKL